MRCVSLFRGINVGGNHVIPMKDLRALHESLGLENVGSVIQSGNVVFDSDRKPAELEQSISDAVADRFGFRVPVLVRTADEIRKALAACPFEPSDETKPNWIAFVFLRQGQGRELDAYDGPEQIRPGKRLAYVYYTEGMGRSKLNLERYLKTDWTVRNRNVVAKIAALL